MDRLFLDANVLFSAAYRQDSRLQVLWQLPGAELLSSRYAVDEALRNLTTDEQRSRLKSLAHGLALVPDSTFEGTLFSGIGLPAKDLPILAAAYAGNCTHLITGDVRHFGAYFGKSVLGVIVQTPAGYLRERRGE